MEKSLKIAIGSDHGGFRLKKKFIEYLTSKEYELKDYGTDTEDSCDYPDIAKPVAHAVAQKEYDIGILICGTGVGISITANKQKGIRAVVCSDTFSAKMSKEHNNSNILCLGQRVVGEGLAIEILETWLNAEFQGGRHIKRVEKIEQD